MSSPNVPIRPAATVLLLRDAPLGMEVFMQRRASGMDFAPDVTVFPGGGIEPEDNGDLRRTAARETYEECGVVTDPTQLVPLARWITPPGRSRRYDTIFFVCALPGGQEARSCTTEAVSAQWVRPQAAIDEWRAAGVKLMAPTFSVLFQIRPHPDAATALRWTAENADLTAVDVAAGGRREERLFPGWMEYAAGLTIE